MKSHSPDTEPSELLRQLCRREELNNVLHSFHYIQGVIFAVAAAPEIPMPDQWLLWVFEQRGRLSSVEQADQLTDVLMKSLQAQLQGMRDDKHQMPIECELPDIKMAADQLSKQPLCQWMNGLLAGHSLLDSVWQESWQKMQVECAKRSESEQANKLSKDLRHCLAMFSTFADIPLAIEQARDKDLETMLPRIYLSLPVALQTYVGLSGKLVDYLPNQFETFVQPP